MERIEVGSRGCGERGPASEAVLPQPHHREAPASSFLLQILLQPIKHGLMPELTICRL